MNGPTYLSSFIGREDELAEVRAILQDKGARLLTLTGPGGSGKTRLANQAVTALDDRYEDGITWVDLVGLGRASSVLQTVAAALGIAAAPGQSLQQALTNGLQPREQLIVLDNCEHIAEACADLVTMVAGQCPSIYFLATSRGALGVQGEYAWQVPPLSLPDGSNGKRSLDSYDSARLFEARARQVQPNFRLADQDQEALIQILRLLDGQPLAIELAAARLSALEIPQMVGKLEDQLSFLADRAERGEPRHHSIEAAIGWSYQQLSSLQALLFRRLGVFLGTFSLEAAEQVCAFEPIMAKEVLDLLDGLIRQSLIQRAQLGGNETRYRMLEAVRQFAVQELAKTDETDVVKDRHWQHFAALADHAQAHMLGPDQRDWTGRLERDRDNVRVALGWAFSRAQSDKEQQLAAAQLVASLYWPWNYSERYQEAINWVSRARALEGVDQHSELMADLHRYQATFVWLSGDYPTAKELLSESMKVCEAIGYAYCNANARLLYAILSLHEKKVEEAIAMLKQCEATFIRLSESRELSIAWTNLGSAYMELGQLELARDYAERAVANARANDDPWGQGLALQILGTIVHLQGEPELALPMMEEALGLLELVGQGWLQAETLWRQGNILHEVEQDERAIRQLERCFELSEDIGATEWQLSALSSLGFIALQRGQRSQAIGYFSQVFRLAPADSYLPIQTQALLGAIELASGFERWDWAVELWHKYRSLKPADLPRQDEAELPVKASLESHFQGDIPPDPATNEQPASLAEATRQALEILYRLETPAPALSTQFNLRLLGLGPADAYLNGEQLLASDWTFAKPKELLFYLASNPAKTKEELGVIFWPEASSEQLRSGLRAALYHLRNALGDRDWIVYQDGKYRFNREMNYWYDMEAFEAGLKRGEELAASDPASSIESLQQALSLYRGDFIADIAEDEWASVRRAELRRKYTTNLGLLAEILLEQGEVDRAEMAWHQVLAEDPLLEDAHRGLMRCYALRGEQALISRQYEQVAAILNDELGVEPSSETSSLYRSLVESN